MPHRRAALGLLRPTAVALAACCVLATGACGNGDPTTAPVDAGTATTAVPTPTPADPSATVTDVRRVRPPEGHPLATVDRDAGVTARLRDGSLLWLFGDTAARRDDGTVEYFVVGTAAWSPADDPTTTDLVVDAAGTAPVPFVQPDVGEACSGEGQRSGAWPASAVVQPVATRDRVVVWLDLVCLGPGDRLADLGTAVAEWWYDPAAPPATGPSGTPITGTIVQPRLFEHRSFGSAAVLVDDDTVTAYACATPADPTDRSGYGPCRVAEVPVDRVTEPAEYRVVDDDLALPRGIGEPVPPGGFGVAFDPTLDAWVMVYSPWPGTSEVVDVRTAPSPVGPWSAPVTVSLPGCDDRIGERPLPCYAADPQPAVSTAGGVGIGWYDSAISTFPQRGSFMVGTVPLAAFDR